MHACLGGRGPTLPAVKNFFLPISLKCISSYIALSKILNLPPKCICILGLLPLIFSTWGSYHSTEPPPKDTTVVSWLSEASLAVSRLSKIAGQGGKFEILQSDIGGTLEKIPPEEWLVIGIRGRPRPSGTPLRALESWDPIPFVSKIGPALPTSKSSPATPFSPPPTTYSLPPWGSKAKNKNL